jgi:heparin/heparan-sulfate lyase
MSGDATKSYSSHKLSNFTRHILFIFPDYFIIFDQISSKNPNFRKSWLLHSVNEPELKGNEITVTEGRGKLYDIVLYPSKFSINKIGGSGKEFLVNGNNYPHNDELFPGNIPGDWRIEIQPTEPRADDIFLNLLGTSKIDEKYMPKIERIEVNDGCGALLGLSDLIWAVIFNNQKNDGKIIYSIKSKGKVRNLIFNLIPNTEYEIKQNNIVSNVSNTDKDGMLDFEINNLNESILELKRL